MRDGQLPRNWRESQLGTLGTVFRGRGGSRSDEEINGLPCIRYGDLYTHHDCIVRSFASAISPTSAALYTRLHSGDLVFAGSGETFEEIGKAAAYCDDAQAYAGADTIILRPGPGLDPRFAGYAVNGEQANRFKSRMGQGSSVIHISAEHLSRLPLRLPPILEQERIAAILVSIDEAIVYGQALIAKTEQIKAGLMHDLFTRGVGADAKLRPPRMEAPHLYKLSALGWIPKSWDCSLLDDLLAATKYPMRSGPFGSSLLKEELAESGIPVLGIDNVRVEHFDAKFRRFVTYHKFADLRRYAVLPGDLVITIMGTVGRCCVVPADIGEALSSKHLWTMTFNRNRVLPELICWQLNHAPWVKGWFTRQAQGAVMDAIQSSTLRTLRLPTPPMAEQHSIRERYLACEAMLSAERTGLQKLRQQKAGLMSELLTGLAQATVEVHVDYPEDILGV